MEHELINNFSIELNNRFGSSKLSPWNSIAKKEYGKTLNR